MDHFSQPPTGSGKRRKSLPVNVDGIFSRDTYSLHDIGLGPEVFKSSTIKQGKYELSFEWDGRNWTGPSDYGHPKGGPFPAGDYTLQVRLAGRVKTLSGDEPYEIKESVQVTLTE